MIENEKQYEVTSQQLIKLRRGLADIPDEPPENVHPKLHEAQKEGVKTWIARLESQLMEWESKQDAGFGGRSDRT